MSNSPEAEPSVETTFRLPTRLGAIAVVPDSLLAPRVRAACGIERKPYIQVTNESQAVAVCAGYSLACVPAIACMENSGVRAACETIARLTDLHGISLGLLLANRGRFGDPNWWAQRHVLDTTALLQHYGIQSVHVRDHLALEGALEQCIDVLQTRQASAAVIVDC